MNAKAATCPTNDLLAEFGLGKLDPAKVETISAHLETCADCRRVVAGLPSDSFVGRLRAAQPQGSPAKPGRSQDSLPPGFKSGESVSIRTNRSETRIGGESLASMPSLEPIPAAPAPNLAIPQELVNHADYEVLRELGRGGMGVVYLARNRMMDRMEVLKVVSRALLDRPGSLERFLQEIRSAARLSHPNIVAAYSVLQMGQLLVFAMEYVDGQDLSQVVKRRGPLPVVNAAVYANQAALGLQHAHEKGMVHRDIKPNNLMLAQEGKKHTVKILDFGLAKATSEKANDGGLTRTGQMLGTPDYIAPEQMLDAQKADIRADIYSLGCTLYFLLSGKPPFDGNSLYEVLQAHQMVEARALNLVRSDVPLELAMVVAKMMAKDPAKRFQTPAEVSRALVPFFKAGAAGQAAAKPEISQTVVPVAAQPLLVVPQFPAAAPVAAVAASSVAPVASEVIDSLSADESASSDFRNDRDGAGSKRTTRAKQSGLKGPGMYSIAVLVVGVVGLAAILWVRANHWQIQLVETDPAVATKHAARAEHAASETSSARQQRDGEMIIASSDRAGTGESARHAQSVPQSDPVDQPLREIRDQPTSMHQSDLSVRTESSPDRAALPASGLGEQVTNKQSTSGAQVVLEGHQNSITHLLFSSTGSLLFSASNGDRNEVRGHVTHLVPGADDGIRVWDVSTGNHLHKFVLTEGHHYGPQGMCLSPDGRYLAVSTSWNWANGYPEPLVYVWDTKTKDRTLLLKPPGDRAMRAVSFSTDGSRLFARRSGTGLHSWLFPVGNEGPKIDLENTARREVPPAMIFSSGCDYIVEARWKDNGLCIWSRQTGKVIKTYSGPTKIVTGLSLSPDGKRLLACAGDSSLWMWDVESAHVLFHQESLKSPLLSVAFSPDGMRFITGGEDATVRLWNAANGTELARFTGHSDKVHCVLFSPNGHLAASGSADKTIRIWSLGSQHPPGTISGASEKALAAKNASLDDPINAKLDQAKHVFNEEMENYRSAVAGYFEKQEAAARTLSNKKLLDQVSEDRTAFEQTGKLPAAAVILRKRLAAVRTPMELAYQSTMRAYTKANQRQDAAAIETEFSEFLAASGNGGTIASKGNNVKLSVSFDQSVPISSRKEFGHEVRRIRKRERIVLQYISGKWKGWGRAATESPDAAVQEQGDRCRLAICEVRASGTTKVLAVVPPGTQMNPFVWIAETDYDKIVLRINDNDGIFNSNPDGKVIYRLKLLTYTDGKSL